jgi:hypothetical protein
VQPLAELRLAVSPPATSLAEWPAEWLVLQALLFQARHRIDRPPLSQQAELPREA